MTSYHDPCSNITGNFNIYVNGIMITGTPICGTGSITTGKWGKFRPRVWQCVHDAISEAVESQGSACASYATNWESAVQCDVHLPEWLVRKLQEVEIPAQIKRFGKNFTCGGAAARMSQLII